MRDGCHRLLIVVYIDSPTQQVLNSSGFKKRDHTSAFFLVKQYFDFAPTRWSSNNKMKKPKMVS